MILCSNQTVAGLKLTYSFYCKSFSFKFKSDRCGIETHLSGLPSKEDESSNQTVAGLKLSNVKSILRVLTFKSDRCGIETSDQLC